MSYTDPHEFLNDTLDQIESSAKEIGRVSVLRPEIELVQVKARMRICRARLNRMLDHYLSLTTTIDNSDPKPELTRVQTLQ